MKLALVALVAGSLQAAAAFAASPVPTAPPNPVVSNSCVDCHLAVEDARISPPAKAIGEDVHARAGFPCASCHGGDPGAEDQEIAHDPKRGFRGKPSPRDVPALCGNCHADAAAMKHFNPALRVDQLLEYRTSGHGKKLLQGDETVATCVSCHGAHGILPVKDSRSPVYPTHIAKTCNHCHGDAKLMSAHGMPADAYEKYSQSVHHEALIKKGDLSAPTCNSCHGNHGAAPPQVGSVANVCGTCHSIFAGQFKASPHWEAFAQMGLPGCVTCHENHRIIHPTDAFLSTGKEGKCLDCHEPGTKGANAAAAMYADLVRLQEETHAARAALNREAEAGMEVSRAEFDLARADEALTKARTDVHFFQPYAVHKAVAGGLAVARTARVEAARIQREREFRRKGLVVSLVLIFAAIVGLVLKIRDLDRRRGTHESR